MDSLDQHFQQFLRERIYLHNVAPKTSEWYRDVWHPRVVMETLGHSQISLTLDTYSHVLPGLQAEAAHRMQEALGENGGQNGCRTETSVSADE
jgi:hypothetical protein